MSENPDVVITEEDEEVEFKVFENTSHSLVATRELENMRLAGELLDCNLQVSLHLKHIKFGIIHFIKTHKDVE